MLLVELITLIVSVLNYRRHRTLRVFTYYILFSMAQMFADLAYFGFGKTIILKNFLISFTNLFMLFEFSVGIIYILRNISGKGRKIAIYIDAALYLGLLALVGIKDFRFLYQGSFFLFESFFMLLPCLLYYYDLFISGRSERLTDEPSFWIVTGFVLLDACSIPMYMAWSFTGRDQDDIYAMNYILYTILFLLMIRAYRCPPINPPSHAAYR
jgi:hypothetical protein